METEETLDETSIPAEVIAELKAKHGEALFGLEHMGVEVLAVPPSRPVWNRFRICIMDESKQAVAMEQLVRDCVVYPDRKAFDAILTRLPGLVETFGKPISKAGGSGGEAKKKAV